MRPLRLTLCHVLIILSFVASAQNEVSPIFQSEPRPIPSSVQIESGLRLETYFASLKPGGIGLLRLSGSGILKASAEFRGKVFPFFAGDDEAQYALVAADMNTAAGTYTLTVLVEGDAGDVIFARELRLQAASFITQALKLTGERAYLASAEIETREYARLDALTAISAAEPLWDATGFELPHASELTTPFGAFRVLNNERRTRHTGWDQNVPSGTPIRALAAGEARFAGPLELRGNYVLIDHGLGIFSGYAHFSELLVHGSQRVEAGQVIGLSGNTGRSSAPHLHWEIVYAGEWVDGLAFLDLWLPSPRGANARASAQS
ncbi:MAG: M23 family metallopeptidase [Chloroflexi bacterium]|nr:M23 family metallopeptidase [Chloroflexota bacterium]